MDNARGSARRARDSSSCAKAKGLDFARLLGFRRLSQRRLDRVAVEAAAREHGVEPLAPDSRIELRVAALRLRDRAPGARDFIRRAALGLDALASRRDVGGGDAAALQLLLEPPDTGRTPAPAIDEIGARVLDVVDQSDLGETVEHGCDRRDREPMVAKPRREIGAGAARALEKRERLLAARLGIAGAILVRRPAPARTAAQHQ